MGSTPRDGQTGRRWVVVGIGAGALIVGLLVGTLVLGGSSGGGSQKISQDKIESYFTDAGMNSGKAACVAGKLADAAEDGTDALDSDNVADLMDGLIDDCDFELSDVEDLQSALQAMQADRGA